jgi:AmmeMemoRadiSam system protein B
MTPAGRRSELLVSLRDPQRFAKPLVVPYGVALAASLMNGRRTLSEIRAAFAERVGAPVEMENLRHIVRLLDGLHYLAGPRFEQYRRREVQAFLRSPLRKALLAGASYPRDPEKLRRQVRSYFTADGGPGPAPRAPARRGKPLAAVISPHIDFARGGRTYAWAYRELAARCRAETLVIFGTAHHPLRGLFSVTRKDFATPRGVVRTDQQFIDRLADDLSRSVAGRTMDLFDDELAHRGEHSIEFQAVFLQMLFGRRRPLQIVPVLVGSQREWIERGELPAHDAGVQAFLAAVRTAAEGCPGGVCYIAAADLAHIGPQFGDPDPLDAKRLAAQARHDAQLLRTVCRGRADDFFRRLAANGDHTRVCGLAPIYTMLSLIQPAAGRLLHYDQAVAADGTSCVSFAALAFDQP